MTHLEIIIKEMHETIGVDFDGFENKEGWMSEHSWTPQQKESFKEWFIGYLRSNKEAREEILIEGGRYWGKEYLERVWKEFDFQYGWSDSQGI